MPYNCSCPKCQKSFVSDDDADYDGEAFCSECKESNKKIAAKIDEMIANRRANRQPKNNVNVYEELRKDKNKRKVHYLNLK